MAPFHALPNYSKQRSQRTLYPKYKYERGPPNRQIGLP